MKVHKPTLWNRMMALGMLAVAVQLANAQLGPNLVVNGSFETPVSDNNWGRNPSTWFVGQSFGGWTVTQGNVGLERSGLSNVAAGNAYDGVQYIDLNGENAVGGIAQNILISGSGIYRLQFAMSGNTGYDLNLSYFPNSPRPMQVRLAQGNSIIFDQTFTWKRSDHPSHQGHGVVNGLSYQVHTVDILIATPGTYTLSFTSLYTEGPYGGPILDDVRLQLVPEPASMIALGSGLIGLLARARRRVA